MDLTTIRGRIKMIEDLEGENHTAREMLKSALENDQEYTDLNEQAKEMSKTRKQAKNRVLSAPEIQSTAEDIKSNQDEIKTLREILSAELAEYYNKNKTDEIEGADGEPRKFKVIVKLLPRRQSYDKRDSFGQYSK